ncbi:MAG TPA: hypothetical protein VFY10_13665 [Dehalococcoidia bacterium]|nr:hypothetical protein [Dehalococcoidia bacterium]
MYTGISMTYPVLTAVGTDRVIDPNVLDAPLVLICYAQATQVAGEAIEAAIRERYPDAHDLILAHVIDLHGVPRMFRGVAEGILRNEYKKAVEALPEGQLPYDYTIILPDWDGGAIAALGFEDLGKHAGVAVFAPPGRLAGTDQSDGAASGALNMLESID